jgi:glycosyltransferase involved in cell wall biosynthesis
MNLVYVVNEYPTLTETFVYNEIIALKQLGANVWFYPLRTGSAFGFGTILNDWCLAPPISHFLSGIYLLEKLILNPLQSLKWISQTVGKGAGSFKLNLRRFLSLAHAVRLCDVLLKNLKNEQTIHLHAHFGGRTAEVCQFIKTIAGYQYSVTVHAADIYVADAPGLLENRLRNAAFVRCISNFGRQYLIEKNILSDSFPTEIIHSGIPVDDYVAKTNQDFSQKVPIVLSIGRAVEKKGFKYLVEAAAVLRKTDDLRKVRWIVVGDGPLLKELRKFAVELGCDDIIEFPGALPQNKIKELYSQASMFVLPCVIAQDGDMDGIPTVLMEAMASKLPVVSTKISGIPELISDGISGILVDPYDSIRLAQAIQKILNCPSLAYHLACEGHRIVTEHFQAETQAKKLYKLFQSRIPAEKS